MKTITELKVRPYECDSYSHVNNAVYLNYLEMARMDFLNKSGFDYNGIVAEGFYLYVTHVDIYYKASALLNDELEIETYPTQLKHITGQMHQIIRKKDGTICAEADVTWASVTKTGRPSKLPGKYLVEGLKPETDSNQS